MKNMSGKFWAVVALIVLVASGSGYVLYMQIPELIGGAKVALYAFLPLIGLAYMVDQKPDVLQLALVVSMGVTTMVAIIFAAAEDVQKDSWAWAWLIFVGIIVVSFCSEWNQKQKDTNSTYKAKFFKFVGWLVISGILYDGVSATAGVAFLVGTPVSIFLAKLAFAKAKAAASDKISQMRGGN